MRNVFERVLAATIIAVVVLGSILLLIAMNGPKAAPHRVGLPSYCANGQVPTGCIFGLQHSPYVIQSAYYYEASLLGYSTPVGDYDYMLPYGSEYARLPGGSWDHYGWRGAVYIPGSGWAAEFTTPNGGRFAYLHLQTINTGVGTAFSPPPPPNDVQLVFPANRSGDENTAAAAKQSLGVARMVVGSGDYRGNQVVGLTGWPTWAIYGNGSFGPADSHLCLVLDSLARDWFWKVALGRDHKPRHFPVKRWGTTPYKDRYGHLVWSAAWTYQHFQTSIYPHLRGDRWFGHTATRRYGYVEYKFRGSRQGQVLRCWKHYKRCRLSTR